ncbi:MAG TPA: hypothetical protein VMT80_01685 [Candidatus Paceibacterota bacterium]|nr:hypothetical protein [Candidatus Paceibacterota bacterium]
MRRASAFILLSAALSAPALASAAPAPATLSAFRNTVVADSASGNAYAAGLTVTLVAPVAGDFSSLAGSMLVAAPVAGDALLIGGSAALRAPVTGDVRAIGGRLSFYSPIGGDLAAIGASVRDEGKSAGSVFVAAFDAALAGGADGPVRIYGNSVSLSGEYAKDVQVVSSGRLTLLPGTIIRGKLVYRAPEPAEIPNSAKVLGGIAYTNTSYLPSSSASRVLSYLSIGIFLLVRILGALILAGLFAGLFPRFAESFARRADTARLRSTLLTALLGFAALVATPVLLVLLALTFVGLGIAALLFVLYLLLAFLAAIYAGILTGALAVRRFGRRETVRWSDGVLGMLVLSLILLVPYAGPLLVALLMMYCAGALLLQFFQFAFLRS